MQLTEGAYGLSIEVERGDTTAAFHPAAIETGAGLLLIDAGLPGTTDQLAAALEAAGFDWGDVSTVLFTHQDGDHAGAGAAVRERTGAVTLAHERAAPFLDGREAPIKGDGERYPPAPIDVEFGDGVTFNTAAGPADVIATPGHAPGHVSVHFPDAGLLLAADALTVADGELRGPSPEHTLDMERAAASVAALTDLSFQQVFCYHGGAVDADADDLRRVYESLRE